MRVLLLIIALILAIPAFAVEPDEMLADPVLEARAQALDEVIRCVQCQSENIASSNAGWAKDARLMSRQLILEGQSDSEVLDFFVVRYGERVLMHPRRDGSNLILWIAGPLMLGLSLLVLVLYVRRSKPISSDQLTPEEEARMREILDDGDPET